MKKIASILLLTLMLVSAGCGSSNSCNFTGLTPGGTYVIVITDPNTNVSSTFQRVASSSGTITVSTRLSCGNVAAIPAIRSNFALSATPSSVYLLSPPATVTVTGQSFDMTYGMPRVDYFDSNGYLVGGVYATSVSGGGTSLDTNTPDLSNVYSGTYQIQVTNKTSSGYYVHNVGSATMTGWGRDRLDSDGDGWYDDEDCNPDDPYYTNNCAETCGGYGTTPRTLCEPIY